MNRDTRVSGWISRTLQKRGEVQASPEQLSRRGFLGNMGVAGTGLSLSALVSGCSLEAQNNVIGAPPNTRRLRAAFSNNSIKTSAWCIQGKNTAEAWGKWFGVDITWYDGGASIDQQRKALDDIADKKWDFVAVQAVGVDTLIEPVQQLLDKGIPVIQMDTEIDSSHSTNITTFIAPDNVFMGAASATALFEKMGGQGKVIMTQGQLGHTGAQGRAKGFYQALAKYPAIELIAKDPADWDDNKVRQLWESYLGSYSDIGGAFFHNDQMALVALKVMQSAGRSIPIAGIDALPAGIEAVINGTMATTVLNSAGRIHWGAVMVGILAVNGTKNIPGYILADGPVVTQQNGPGLIFMEGQFLS